jgi:hypothetical protein
MGKNFRYWIVKILWLPCWKTSCNGTSYPKRCTYGKELREVSTEQSVKIWILLPTTSEFGSDHVLALGSLQMKLQLCFTDCRLVNKPL